MCCLVEEVRISKSSAINPDPIEIPAAKSPKDDLRLVLCLWLMTIVGDGRGEEFCCLLLQC